GRFFSTWWKFSFHGVEDFAVSFHDVEVFFPWRGSLFSTVWRISFGFSMVWKFCFRGVDR
ncbi:MAG: hypothetical protein WCY59_03640, partial [Anaerovoracaceae bacterium]